MAVKRRKLVLRYSSPVTMWLGMLFACFAWVMHLTPLLAPLWDEHTHLGQSLHTELTSLVVVAEQYERIKTDINDTDHTLPKDSVAHHWHHHTAHPISVSSSTVEPISTNHADLSQEGLHDASHTNDAPEAEGAHSDKHKHTHANCELYAGISPALVPVDFTHTDSALIELSVVPISYIYHIEHAHYSSHFLRPLTRAPPQATLV